MQSEPLGKFSLCRNEQRRYAGMAMNFESEARLFLDKMSSALKAVNLDLTNFELDHLCYRTETMEQYRSLKAQLCLNNELMHEAIIGGRAICSFKLAKPLEYDKWRISLLELPAPKSGSFYPLGFEHAEFVVPHMQNFIQQRSDLAWDSSGLKKDHNPEIKLGLAPDVNIKFHLVSLEKLVLSERKML